MSVDRSEDVMEMVEKELRDNPDISNEKLIEKANEIEADIAELSARQFNARYPLQVKRQLKAERQEQTEPERAQEETEADDEELRSAVREVLLEIARSVAGAEDQVEMIDALASVDRYVDRVVDAA